MYNCTREKDAQHNLCMDRIMCVHHSRNRLFFHTLFHNRNKTNDFPWSTTYKSLARGEKQSIPSHGITINVRCQNHSEKEKSMAILGLPDK